MGIKRALKEKREKRRQNAPNKAEEIEYFKNKELAEQVEQGFKSKTPKELKYAFTFLLLT